MRAVILGIFLAGFVVSIVHATPPTQAERDACDPDARRLCAGAILNVLSDKPIEARVYECLKKNKTLLSPGCRQAFANHGQ